VAKEEGMRFKIMAALVLLWGLYLAIADGLYLTPWFAVLWGILGAVALWQRRIHDGRIEQALPGTIQFVLAVCLIVATLLATHWAGLGRRDLIQWGYAVFLLTSLADGFVWARSVVTQARKT
jgi:hypothetical protein